MTVIQQDAVEAAVQRHLESLVLIDVTRKSDALHALLHVMGISQAELAGIVGLDRSRINHFDSGMSPVPAERNSQFKTVLEMYLADYEARLGRLQSGEDEYPGWSLADVAVPVAKAKIAACRKILKAA